LTRVLVDARPLSAASSTRGIGAYLSAVLPKLAREPDFEIQALATRQTRLPEGVGKVPIRRFSRSRLNFHEQLVLLPFGIRRVEPDVFLGVGTDPPLACSSPWVQVLFDVIPLSFPHPAFAPERRRWRLRARSLRKASALAVASRHTAEQVVQHLGLERDRLHLVYPGVDARFVPPPVRQCSDRPFLLYVSEYGPHKGFAEAFDVISRLADAGLPHRLVVVGRMEWRGRALVTKLVQRAGHPERVDLRGYVRSSELTELYQQASLVAVTSRYEGFGLPAVEAMASGTPVVAFDNSSLPEVIGDAGILVPDGDVDAFAVAAAHLLGDSRQWADLSAAGITRSRLFDWDRCASSLADVIRSVAT
jgi:glycosyltransferase involved in cell wall biosynthesis